VINPFKGLEPGPDESYEDWKARVEQESKSVSGDTVMKGVIPYLAAYSELDRHFWAYIQHAADHAEVDGPFNLSLMMTHTAHAVNLACALAVGEFDLKSLIVMPTDFGDPFNTAQIGIDAIRAQGRTGELVGWANHQQGLLDAARMATGWPK
jgi:hypothetical protein